MATNIANRTSIHQRPKKVGGIRFDDWERDTVVDPYGHAILTLTERSTNFILMERLPHGRKVLPTARAVARLLFPYRSLLKTITTGNGCEFAVHFEITRLLSMKNHKNFDSPLKRFFRICCLTLHLLLVSTRKFVSLHPQKV